MNNQNSAKQLMDVAQRIRNMRNILGYSIPKMAELTEITEEQYRLYESGEADLPFTFMHKCAKAFGVENLPKEGGYMMYPNHQGKYDVLGIMHTHKEPCSFVMDIDKSYTMLVREFIDLVQGKRLEKNKTYYVRIGGYWDDATHYKFVVKEIRDDIGDDFPEATKLKNKKTKTGKIQIEDDVDFFSFKTDKKKTDRG